MRTYPQWFIDELVDEEVKQKAISGELKSNEFVDMRYPCCGSVYNRQVKSILVVSTMEKKGEHICRRCLALRNLPKYIEKTHSPESCRRRSDKARVTRKIKNPYPQWFINELALDADKELAMLGKLDQQRKHRFVCEKHGEYVQWIHNHMKEGKPYKGCPMCNKGNATSRAEDMVQSWLCNYSVERNTRGTIKSPSGHWMELDLYLPEEHFAVECDGSYYHKESDMSYNKWQLLARGKSKDEILVLPKWKGYHKWKDEKCAEKGIKLIHVVSEDVIDFPDKTKAYILEELEKWKEINE